MNLAGKAPAKPYYSSTIPGPLYRAHGAARVTELYQLSAIEGVYNQNAAIMSHSWPGDLEFAHTSPGLHGLKGLSSMAGRDLLPGKFVLQLKGYLTAAFWLVL
jgi:hypothetical protein